MPARDESLLRAYVVPRIATAERINRADRVAALHLVTPGRAVGSGAGTGPGSTRAEATGAEAGRLAGASVVPRVRTAEKVNRTNRVATVNLVTAGRVIDYEAVTGAFPTGLATVGALAGRPRRTILIPFNIAAERVKLTRSVTACRILAAATLVSGEAVAAARAAHLHVAEDGQRAVALVTLEPADPNQVGLTSHSLERNP